VDYRNELFAFAYTISNCNTVTVFSGRLLPADIYARFKYREFRTVRGSYFCFLGGRGVVKGG
jgi:hypothetical protein